MSKDYTFEPAERLPVKANNVVAEYSRGIGKQPYRVIHDRTLGGATGTFRIFVDSREIGRQVSWPTHEDCRRIENPVRVPFATVQLTYRNRAALGGLTQDEKARRSGQRRSQMARKRANEQRIKEPA